jgi:putative chitinase
MTPETLSRIVGKSINANMNAFLRGMTEGGDMIEWESPIVQAHLLAQVCHESGGFLYDREIWGPTSAQRGYEDRSDLGHSSAVANEAFLFRGKGPMQVTGRYNHRAFYQWAKQNIDPNAPDFEQVPDAILTDPWEGLSVVWYWHTKKLTALAKANDFENITKRINGGYNGLSERMRWFGRAALGILGQNPSGLVSYQQQKGLLADGIAGTNTRRELFVDLSKFVVAPAPAPTAEVVKLRDQIARAKAVLEE